MNGTEDEVIPVKEQRRKKDWIIETVFEKISRRRLKKRGPESIKPLIGRQNKAALGPKMYDSTSSVRKLRD